MQKKETDKQTDAEKWKKQKFRENAKAQKNPI
jgi:hypothetical protein